MYEIFKLEQLVEKVDDNLLSLPLVQRGFVWRPYQIENFLDSLLRMYPVGSFVATKNKLELLDGQQRLTSICLGFHNPLLDGEHPILKTSSKFIRVFIDLAKPPAGDNRKYIFRVITRSHPWGYQRRENQKPLKTIDIDKAKKLYGIEEKNYLNISLDEYWPYDAGYPLPIGIFLNSNSWNDLQDNISKWENLVEPKYRKHLPEYYT